MKTEEKKFYIAELVLILEHLHRNGVVHRDLKPENIMLGEDRHLRLIDYGTVGFFNIETADQKFLEEIREKMMASKKEESAEEVDSYQLVHKSTFVGTCEYMSPENLKGEETGPGADLWALGVIIYRLMVGCMPFQAQSQFLLFNKINSCQFEPIPHVNNLGCLGLNLKARKACWANRKPIQAPSI
jgi:3-phosphoinositide dependent protein kinase-1